MQTIHLCLVIATLIVVLYADEQGLMWMRGKKQRFEKRHAEIVHTVIGVGICLIVLTGGLMFIDRAGYLWTDPLFLTKMVLVLALIVNSFFISSLATIADEKPYAETTSSEKRRVLLSGGISVACWAGAFACGWLL